MSSPDMLADAVLISVRNYLARSIAPVLERLTDAERSLREMPIPKDGKDGIDGKDGVDGKDIDLAALHKSIEEKIAAVADTLDALVRDQLAMLPIPKDGKDGVDGKDIDLAALHVKIEIFVASAVDAFVSEKIAQLPIPKDGKDGVDGKDGSNGRDGATPDVGPLYAKFEAWAVAADLALRNVVDVAINKAVAAIPIPSNGIDGKDGESGPKGERGESGLAGKDGAPGRDGKDVDSGFVKQLVVTIETMGSEIAALHSTVTALRAAPSAPSSFLINEAGDLVACYPDGTTSAVGHVRGDDGERGASVMDGSVKEDGMLVLRMSDGRIINAGLVRGASGKDGVTGSRGRDAHEIQILPGIDEGKSYAEGVCALYAGGVIRAFRQTDPIVDGRIEEAGWRVLQEGIASETEQVLDGGRVILRETRYTSGRVAARKLVTATTIYRGVWRDGTYERGDQVARGGSMWICERTTTTEPGNGASDWVLSTKKGADGRNGKDGLRGERGPAGNSGRDLTQLGFDGGKH